jgi:alpha-L-fucosidase
MPAYSSAYSVPTQPEVLDALASWRDLKFGALVHFSPGFQFAGPESWTLCGEDHEWNRREGQHAADYAAYKAAYERLPRTFNPVDFDASVWAATMRGAGMRYAVLPTKHHDGFCMWDTAETDYRVTGPECAYARHPQADVFGALTSAVRREGLRIGAYFSKPDWHSDDYWWRYFPTPDRNVNYDPHRYPERWRRFVEFTHRQIAEITTRYGRIDILWLDGGWIRPHASTLDVDPELAGELGGFQATIDQDINMEELVRIARRLHPAALVIDRTVAGEYENYLTPEQGVPAEPIEAPWESCVSLGSRWHSEAGGTDYKSAAEIIDLLVTVVARGGNLLLGIGPTSTGELVPIVQQRLTEIGAWLEINGSAIYETRAPDVAERDGIRFTASKDGRILNAFVDPSAVDSDGRVFIPLPCAALGVTVLGHDAAECATAPAGVVATVGEPPSWPTCVSVRLEQPVPLASTPDETSRRMKHPGSQSPSG